MPLPPPDTPPGTPTGAADTVAGWLPGGGGNGDCSTRLADTRFAGTEPVTSLGDCCRDDAKGLSLKRVESPLQPATPNAISASAVARGDDHERNNSTSEFMAYSLTRNKTIRRVNTWEVNKTLSN
jgi:hypothetical protein